MIFPLSIVRVLKTIFHIFGDCLASRTATYEEWAETAVANVLPSFRFAWGEEEEKNSLLRLILSRLLDLKESGPLSPLPFYTTAETSRVFPVNSTMDPEERGVRRRGDYNPQV